MPQPIISCICITRNRPDLLQRAISCFLAQTYLNKELIVLYEDNNTDTKELLKLFANSDNIKMVQISAKPKKTLGELRNIAIGQASGEYICQWDDDDWYHINRLQAQLSALQQSGLSACTLGYWLLLNQTNNKLYISSKYNWEGSVLCRKEVFRQTAYAHVRFGEERPVFTYLEKEKQICTIEDMPYLYVYTYHGKNTWNSLHWKRIFRLGKALDSNVCKGVFELLDSNKSIDLVSKGIEAFISTPIPE